MLNLIRSTQPERRQFLSGGPIVFLCVGAAVVASMAPAPAKAQAGVCNSYLSDSITLTSGAFAGTKLCVVNTTSEDDRLKATLWYGATKKQTAKGYAEAVLDFFGGTPVGNWAATINETTPGSSGNVAYDGPYFAWNILANGVKAARYNANGSINDGGNPDVGPESSYWYVLSDIDPQEDPLPVPGPLPLLGAGAAFGWSRRLRRRLKHQSGAVDPSCGSAAEALPVALVVSPLQGGFNTPGRG